MGDDAVKAANEVDWPAFWPFIRTWLPLGLSSGALLLSYLSFKRAGRAEANKTQREIRGEVRRIVQAHKDNLGARGGDAYEPWKDLAALRPLPQRLIDRDLRAALEEFLPRFEEYETHVMNSFNASSDLDELRRQVRYFDRRDRGDSTDFAFLTGPVPDQRPEPTEIGRAEARLKEHLAKRDALQPELAKMHQKIIGILNDREAKQG